MVLEYLQGPDLSNFPRTHLTVGVIVDFILQACEALAEAHSLGIVHRDIKPANFFITGAPGGDMMLKVLDFGISKVPVGNHNLTATSTVMGTPAYMSPEQMRSSRDVDNRSDIWSLGIVLYELLTGVTPFAGETFSSMVLKVATEPLPLPPMQIRLPGDLDQTVYRCLDKDPARRFQNVADLAKALSRHAGSTTQATISVQRTGRMLGTEPPRSIATNPTLGHDPSTLSVGIGAHSVATQAPKKRWPIIVGIGLAVVAITTIGVIGATSGGGATPPPVATPAPAPAAVTPPSATLTPVVEPPQPVKPTPIKPTPVKPTPIKPTPVKPTPIKPTPGKATEPLPDDILGPRN